MVRIAQRQRFPITDDHTIVIELAIAGTKMEVRTRIKNRRPWPFKDQRIEGWTRHMYRGERITKENVEECVESQLAKAAEFVARREENYSVLEHLDISVST